jgi:hypothetical protein
LNLSHLEPIDCPLPNLQILLACVISGIDLIFHSFYREVVCDLSQPPMKLIVREGVTNPGSLM